MDSIRGPSCQIHKECSPNKCPRPRCFAANSEVAVLQPSAGAKVRGACLKMSVKKVEIGKRAAEHGVLTTICY